MSFQNRLSQIQILLQKELTAFFKQKRRKAGEIDLLLLPLIDQIADLTLRGGKRTRPFFVWLGYTINLKLKNKNSKLPLNLIHCMIGLELFHSFALIHDDIIDQDEKRRGGDTIHKYFAKESLHLKVKSLKFGNRFGVSMAILAGDLALSWADECMKKVKSPPAGETGQKSNVKSEGDRVYEEAFDMYQRMKEQVIYGQTLDVMDQFGIAEIPHEKINELKTAWYSVTWPLLIGACLAGAGKRDCQALERYGLSVGNAFQAKDDVMDHEMSDDAFRTYKQRYFRDIREIVSVFSPDSARQMLSKTAAFVVERDS